MQWSIFQNDAEVCRQKEEQTLLSNELWKLKFSQISSPMKCSRKDIAFPSFLFILYIVKEITSFSAFTGSKRGHPWKKTGEIHGEWTKLLIVRFSEWNGVKFIDD